MCVDAAGLFGRELVSAKARGNESVRFVVISENECVGWQRLRLRAE